MLANAKKNHTVNIQFQSTDGITVLAMNQEFAASGGKQLETVTTLGKHVTLLVLGPLTVTYVGATVTLPLNTTAVVSPPPP